MTIANVWEMPGALEDLRQLWIEGKSCTEIGAEITRKYRFKCTRNAVIGKVHRLHLNHEFPRFSMGGPRSKTYTGQRPSKPRPPRPPKPPKMVRAPKVQKAPPPPPVVVDASHARPWTERARFGECAYPIGERGSIMSCCAPIGEGQTYCAGHRAVMFQPAKALKPHDRPSPPKRVLTPWDEGRAAA